MEVARRAKNFKDIRTHGIPQRDSHKQNYNNINSDGLAISPLSFKKLDTQRPYQQFVSPPKQLVISAKPIETINISNKKKEEVLQFRQTMFQQTDALRSKGSERNVSTNSNRSNTSEKQGMFKRFSQLAECTSREKDPTTKSNPLCFQRMISQREQAAKLYQLPMQPVHSQQHLVKKPIKMENTERNNPKPRTAKEKVGEFFPRPSLQPVQSPKAAPPPVHLKDSLHSDFDQVNMSRQSVEALDMSPYFI